MGTTKNNPATKRSMEVLKLMRSMSLSSDDISNNISDIERLRVALIYNFVRDFVWGLLSFTQVNFMFIKTLDPYTQLLVDIVYTIPFFLMVFLALRFYYRTQPCSIFNEIMIPPAFAAWLAIATWDLAQIWMLKICKDSNHIDDEPAGYIAAIATGFAEGPTQYVGALAASWILNDPSAKFNKCDFITSVFPGLIPGAVWQIVYNIFLYHVDCNDMGFAVLGSFSIAFFVASANLAYGKMAIKISKIYRGHSSFPGEHIRARLFSSSFHDPAIRTQSFMMHHPNLLMDLEDIEEIEETDEKGVSTLSNPRE